MRRIDTIMARVRSTMTTQNLLVVASKYGLWAVVALYLGYKGTETFGASLVRIEHGLATHNYAMELDQRTRAQRENQQLRFLQAICVGVNGRNPDAAQLCHMVQ